MIAQHSDTPNGPSRPFSPEIEEQLVSALKGLVAGPGAPSEPSPDATARLRAAMQAAARDARVRDLRAEEMILAFKSVEQRAGVSIPERDERTKESVRSQLIRALLEAYYDSSSE